MLAKRAGYWCILLLSIFRMSFTALNKLKKKKEKRWITRCFSSHEAMDELFKKKEKEHLETIAAMQKSIEELEGTFSNMDEKHLCFGNGIQTTRCFHLSKSRVSCFIRGSKHRATKWKQETESRVLLLFRGSCFHFSLLHCVNLVYTQVKFNSVCY